MKRPLVETGHGWDALRKHDPASYRAYEALADVPWRTGPLDPKVKEYVGIVADGSASGPDVTGLKSHVRNALALGASRAEILDVLRIVSILGIHSSVVGTPILVEELERAHGAQPQATSPRAMEVREAFERRRGYWSPLWESVAALDPEFLQAYLDYSAIATEQGVLDPKVRELLFVALSTVTTHLFPDGARIHIRNAIALGATGDEIVEVFELVSTVGVRALVAGLPTLFEAAE